MNSLLSLPLAEFWSAANGSTQLKVSIIGTILFGILMIFVLMNVPARWRRPIIGFFTFIAGLIYVAYFLWPQPPKGADPVGAVQNVGAFLGEARNTVGGVATTLTAFLLGLGMYSLVGIHLRRLFKMQRDWFYSLVLIISMVVMVIFGYWNWLETKGARAAELQFRENWGFAQYGFDLVFDGLLQQMDAAMFSIIAFYILSAAYRAFRVRSVEATILLATALLVMLSVMGAVEYMWNSRVEAIAGGPNGFLNNFRLTDMSRWISETFQTSSLRALDFGVGIGALAMGLRLWLSLERGGMSS